jgi:hypothetical protein
MGSGWLTYREAAERLGSTAEAVRYPGNPWQMATEREKTEQAIAAFSGLAERLDALAAERSRPSGGGSSDSEVGDEAFRHSGRRRAAGDGRLQIDRSGAIIPPVLAFLSPVRSLDCPVDGRGQRQRAQDDDDGGDHARLRIGRARDPSVLATIAATESAAVTGVTIPTRRGGQCFIHITEAIADRLGAIRKPGESYSDVILRLTAAPGGWVGSWRGRLE